MKTVDRWKLLTITVLTFAACVVAFSQSPTQTPADDPAPGEAAPPSASEVPAEPERAQAAGEPAAPSPAPSEPSAPGAETAASVAPMPLVVLGPRLVYVVDPETRTSRFSADVGQLPEAAVLGRDGKQVYVLSSGRVSSDDARPSEAGKLTIIDTATGTVEKTLPLGWNPTQLLIPQDRRYLFVRNEGASKPKQETKLGHASVLVLDMVSREVLSQIDVPPNAVDMAFSDETRHLFVVSSGYAKAKDEAQGPALAVIDPTMNRVDRLIPLPGSPTGFLGVRDHLFVVVNDGSYGRLQVFEASSHEQRNQIILGDPFVALVPNPSGSVVHLCSENKLLSLEGGADTPPVVLDGPCRGVAVSEDGSRVVAATRKSTYVLDGKNRSVLGRINTGFPMGCPECTLSVSPDGKRSVILSSMDAAIRLFDNEHRMRIEETGSFGRKSVVFGKALAMAATATVGAVGGIPIGGSFRITGSVNFAAFSAPGLQRGMTGFSRDSRYLFAANGFTGDLCVFDLASGQRTSMIPLPGARGVVIPPGGKYLYALGRERTLVLAQETGREIESVRLPAVETIYFDADARHAFFVTSGEISVVDNVDGGVETPIRGISNPRAMAFPPLGS